jgi:lambda family phage portal protein
MRSNAIINRNDATATAFLANLSQTQPSIDAAGSRVRDSAFKLGRIEKAQPRQPVRRSGDSEIKSSPIMQDRVRESFLNVPMVKRAADLIRDLVVGSGVQTFLDPIDWSFGFDLKRRPESDLVHALNVSLEMDEKFVQWSNNPGHCDVQGKKCFVEQQRLAISDEVLTGDSIVMYGPSPSSSSPIPWAILLIEKEQIDTTKDRDFGRLKEFNNIETAVVHGFVIDRYGRELGCYIYDVHPNGILAAGRDSRFIPATQYHHIFSSYRPSQNVGATWLHALGQPAIDLDRWKESELRKAIKQSLVAMIHKSLTPDKPSFGMDDLEGFATEILNAATEIRLGDSPLAATIGKDETVELVESKAPTDGANAFVDMLEHDGAASVNLSYYSMTGQFGKSNYTGFRGASNLEAAQIMPLQYLYAQAFIRPMRQRWNRDAVAFGHIVQLSAKDMAEDQSRWSNIDCIGAGRFLIEPDGETNASLTMMRSGLSSLKYEAGRMGKDWKKLLREMAIINRCAALVDVMLDFSKGNGGQQTATSTAAPTKSRSKDKDTEE